MPADLPFPALSFPVSFKGRTFSFVRPENPDRVLDTISEECYDKDQFLPYWAEHWPSADILLAYLESLIISPEAVACELGAGLGIISAVLAPYTTLCVASDLSPVSGRFAQANISRALTNPAVVCADWRTPPFTVAFDMILGSDILYERRWITPVSAFIKHHLNKNGTAYIADPCRTHWEAFKQQCAQDGLQVSTVHSGLAKNGKSTIEVVRIIQGDF